MTLTANEQYFLELVNRARLDPAGEAKRAGIGLNDGLSPGSISTTAKQVLAPNASLDLAAERHSQWMIDTDTFSHTGVGGSSAGARMTSAGYSFTGSWTWGENISWSGTSGTMNLAGAIDGHHTGLFRSAGHRENLLSDSFREVGIAQVGGQFTASGSNWNASMVTQAFAKSGTAVFLTGVVYQDSDKNKFYSIGEGQAGTVFSVTGGSDTSEAAGGYAIATTASAALQVTATQGVATSVVLVDMTAGNVKLDLVGGTTFLSSGDITLVSGAPNVRLLGTAALTAQGSAAGNIIEGNAGANELRGGGGNDRLNGAQGADDLAGQDGKDRMNGGAGNDRLTGGMGADNFVFVNGSARDQVADFNLSQGDRLMLDDGLWGNVAKTAAEVVAQFGQLVGASLVLDFGDADVLTLANYTNSAALAGQIDFI